MLQIPRILSNLNLPEGLEVELEIRLNILC